MDCIVHGVAKSQTQLSDFHIHIYRDTAIYTIYANMHIDIYVYPCIDTYVYVYTHMHTYIYTQICTYASTHIYDRWLIIQYFSLNFTQTAKINAYCNNLNNRKATKLSLLIHTPPFLFPPFQCNQFFLNNLKFKINLLWIFSIMFFGIHTQTSTRAYSTGHILNFLFFSVSLSNIMWTSSEVSVSHSSISLQ